ncbi:hypothetical protein JKF63_06689 [Porcisia hertigi]|uniref:mRNA 5'-phosphatase n=1 Tax=Porcisia hertigi TaxID=2761500 RepID=A0A836IH21_9TRYP|nr:hypothetical protein JKF63_06689 [Porcisia hertigi]
MQGLRGVPRYRDPLVRNVARVLLRGLQEQHHAPSSTKVELEVRLGSILAHTRARQLDMPIAIASPALIDETARNVYQFQAGISQQLLQGMQLSLLEAGLAARKDMGIPGGDNDVHLFLSNAKRLRCRYQRLHDATVGVRADGVQAAATYRDASLYNPLCLAQGVTVLSAEEKTRLAMVDMCCPGWCADVRFSLSAEKTVSVELTDATREVANASRYRVRACVPLGPFFSVQMTHSILNQDVWWYPPQSVRSFLEKQVKASPSPSPSSSSHAVGADTATFGVGTVIPTPVLFSTDKVVARIGRNDLETTTTEVEVEVNLPALLRAWRRVYGGAAASVYLSTTALVDTTCAGTSMIGNGSLKPSVPSSTIDDDADMRAVVMAEREDPYLLRVAEDLMSVVQLLTKVRVAE